MTVADLRAIAIEDVGGTAGSRNQLSRLQGLTDDELLKSVFSPASGLEDVLTVGKVRKRMENGNHRASLLIEAAMRHALTGEGKITWKPPYTSEGGSIGSAELATVQALRRCCFGRRD